LTLAQTVGLDAEVAARNASVEFAPRGEPEGAMKPVVIAEGSLSDPRITPSVLAMYEALGRRSLLAIPLQSKDRLLGALVVAFGDEREARRHEERFMELLAGQLGSAVENAQLYSELESQVQRVTTLYELGRGLTGVLDTRSLLELVHREVSRVLPVSTFLYEEYSERGGTLREIFRATVPASGEPILESSMGERIPDENSDDWQVIAKGRMAVFNPAKGLPRVAVPVKKQGRVSGLITILGKPDSTYTPSSLRLLESIANLTEIALDRVALYEDTVAKSQEIAERNRELDDFAYVVSHDLKEPLITIEGYSKIVLGEMKDRASDESLAFLSSIVHASGRMKNLIEDLLLLSRVGRSVESEGTVSVRAVIEDVLRDFDFTLRQRSADIRVPGDLPVVQYDQTQLSMVFRNLISNAIKFNVQPNPVVTLSFKTQTENYLFSVQDNGIGIASEHFDRIFVIFQRLNRAEEFQGTGAGLTIVKKIVERHGGKIWLESEEGKGTTFFFTVPR
jgi:signal transduction histidine kinase